jgi:O-antigen/teichoic acid export membrane protein
VIRSLPLKSTLGQQTITYFSAQAFNAFLGLVIAYLLTTALDATEWGRYTFLISVFTMTAVFFDFGVNAASKRLTALNEGLSARRIIASALGVGLAFGIAFVAILLLESIWLDSVFEKGSGSGEVLFYIAPFAVLYPVYEIVTSVAQGTNRISLLSVITVVPRSIYVLVLLILGGIAVQSAQSALMIFLFSFSLVVLFGALMLKPRFDALMASTRTLGKEVKEFGIKLYYGRAIDAVTFGFDKLMLTRFHGLQPTGFYGLAMTLVSPVSMFSRALSASAYKDFTQQNEIPARILRFNTASCLIGGLLLTLACIYGLPYFFAEQYSESLAVLPWLAAGSALAGINTPYHVFLAAKRAGNPLKIMSFITSGLNIVLCLVLIPLFSMIGAAIAYISTYFINLLLNLYYYRRVVSSMKELS